MIRKNSLLCKEENTLQGESHERWDMKKDPKVFDLVSPQNGNQTAKGERVGGEANSRTEDPFDHQNAVET
jgi:hypothetical protein